MGQLIAASMILIIAACNFYSVGQTQKTLTEGKAAIELQKSSVKLTSEQDDSRKKLEDPSNTPSPAPKKSKRPISVGAVASGTSFKFVMKASGTTLPTTTTGISMSSYGATAALGYLIGGSINSYTAYTRVASNFDLVVSGYTSLTYDIGRLSIALAHVAVLMLLVQSGIFKWLTTSLAAVGQMALSNYLTHSIICSTVFCGYRLAQFVPAEWAWRSLTYWKPQPMRKLAGQTPQ